MVWYDITECIEKIAVVFRIIANALVTTPLRMAYGFGLCFGLCFGLWLCGVPTAIHKHIYHAIHTDTTHTKYYTIV